MKRTSPKTFKWLLSGEAAKSQKRISDIENEFIKMIEDEKRKQ